MEATQQQKMTQTKSYEERNRNPVKEAQTAQRLAETRQADLSKKTPSEKNQPQNNQPSAPSNLRNKNRKEYAVNTKKPPVKKKGMGLSDYLFWSTAFIAAIACDVADIIPVGGWVITIFIRPYVMIFLFFQGNCRDALFRVGITTLDYLPIIGMLPATTGCVAQAFYKKAH